MKDWGTGMPVKNELLGRLAGLELHHVFRRNLPYKAGHSRPEVNALRFVRTGHLGESVAAK